MRDSLHEVYCRTYDVPSVLLVTQGGPGALTTIEQAMRSRRCAVLLLHDSGGLAGALSLALEARRGAAANHGRAVGSVLASYEKGSFTPYERRIESLLEANEAIGGVGLLMSYRMDDGDLRHALVRRLLRPHAVDDFIGVA